MLRPVTASPQTEQVATISDTCPHALWTSSTGGPRPGCFYEVPATSIVRDCACAHYASPARAVWDCGPRGGTDAAVDARGCPARQPAGDSVCSVPAETQCQYGYNLSTTCQCAPAGGSDRAWHCITVAQPPSPR